MTRNWSVTVECEGQAVLTISSQHIRGLPDLDPWASTIRGCAQHLLGFIGRPASDDVEGQAQLSSRLCQDDAPTPPNVDELIASAAPGTDEVDAEAVDAGLDGIKGNAREAADADPHGDLPTINVGLQDSQSPSGVQDGKREAEMLDATAGKHVEGGAV
ncbi:hypothetical protein [Cupriavidus pinatubonensis]|uniref:hypothetical protein n=1 Tax=Cupriavidus pinatubonensis TaxID=248026 RepID=UPI001CC790C3|nr:hypothetical protein [Cupriavidus pinatubonensis]